MDNKKHFESAFPTLHYNKATGEANGHSEGMTLRDYFAAKALAGIMGSGLAEPIRQEQFENIAADSYRLADAMLKERVKH